MGRAAAGTGWRTGLAAEDIDWRKGLAAAGIGWRMSPAVAGTGSRTDRRQELPWELLLQGLQQLARRRRPCVRHQSRLLQAMVSTC